MIWRPQRSTQLRRSTSGKFSYAFECQVLTEKGFPESTKLELVVLLNLACRPQDEQLTEATQKSIDNEQISEWGGNHPRRGGEEMGSRSRQDLPAEPLSISILKGAGGVPICSVAK